MLKLTVAEVGKLASVSPNTVVRLEAGKPVNASTVQVIEGAYVRSGIQFIPENGGGAGVRLKAPHKLQPDPTDE